MDFGLKENRIEHLFVEQAKRRKIKTLKFGFDGYPDRIVLLPEGRVIWVELKRPGQKPRPLQRRRALQLQRAGQEVVVVSTVEEVVRFWKNH